MTVVSFIVAVLAATARPARAADLPADGDLVDRARAGERAAFEALYRRHVDASYRLLTRLLGPDADREDLTQRVWIEVFRALGRFRGDAAFTTWIHRITCHVAYEHMRSNRRRPRPSVDVATVELGTVAGDPERAAADRQALDEALSMLGRLKPKKRIAFVLREVEGLPLDEIGRIVGATPAAVGQRVRHAQLELDAMLARRQRRGDA
jgi:RNA polymerase sigma-70 factor (ECF subfamily)